jgi:predicted ATPase
VLAFASRAVAAACRDSSFREAGSVSLRGRAAAVDVFVVKERPRDRTEQRLSPGQGTPFTGRREQLDSLVVALAPGGAAVLLRGDAGSGKSRLLAEARRELRARAPSMRAVVGRARDAAPLLVCLEDLQWADPATRDLAQALAPALRGSRVSLAASMRPGPPDLAGFTAMTLGDLGSAGARALAEAVLGGAVAEELGTWMFERTGGNPYYVEELAGWLRAAGHLAGPPWSLAATPSRIPEGLHGLLVARLDALLPAERETLKAASVLGRIFWSGLVAVLAGGDATASLRSAELRGLLFR